MTGTAAPLPLGHVSRAFDAALAGRARHLELSDGRLVRLATTRWHRHAARGDRWLVRRCQGPTLDLGCGPGRLVTALLARGVPALGVDVSPLAVRYCQRRGAPALQRDAFAPLPEEGRWRHVLLADGNIGIGGDPLCLLRRAATLIGSIGTILVELHRPATGLWRGNARLRGPAGRGPWFPWATVGAEALPTLATAAGLHLIITRRWHRRDFAELVASSG